MRPAIKELNKQHKTAVDAHQRLQKELGTLSARFAELSALEANLTPIAPAIGDDVEGLIQYRLAEQARMNRLDAIQTIKSDVTYAAGELKAQAMDARNHVNRIAGHAWNALAEALVEEHRDLLVHVGQVCEKAGFNLARFWKELPDLAPAECELIENREGFPSWL